MNTFTMFGLLEVENRRIVRSVYIAGNRATIDAHNQRLLDDPMTGTLGELGFGTQELPVSGADIQDEKILGTCHLATGRDDHLGGDITPDLFKRHANATHDDILFAPHKTPNFNLQEVRMKRGDEEQVLIRNFRPCDYLLRARDAARQPLPLTSETTTVMNPQPPRPPLPPFTEESATQKVQAAEDAWNSRDPERVSLAYTPDTEWRNRTDFINGREEVVAFLTKKWQREHDYRLKKKLWAFTSHRIAVRFEYEWHDDAGQWWRSHGNENWEFDANGYMAKRYASINDQPIRKEDRAFHWDRA